MFHPRLHGKVYVRENPPPAHLIGHITKLNQWHETALFHVTPRTVCYLGKRRAVTREVRRAGHPQPRFIPRRIAAAIRGKLERRSDRLFGIVRRDASYERLIHLTATASCFTWDTWKPSKEISYARQWAACRRSTPTSTASSPSASTLWEPRSLPDLLCEELAILAETAHYIQHLLPTKSTRAR